MLNFCKGNFFSDYNNHLTGFNICIFKKLKKQMSCFMRSYFDLEKFYLDNHLRTRSWACVGSRTVCYRCALESFPTHMPLPLRARCALTARSWRSSRAPQLRLTYLDKKWTPCETSSLESHARERRGCFPAHSSGISDRYRVATFGVWFEFPERTPIGNSGETWALCATSSTRSRRRSRNWDRETRSLMNWSWSWTRRTSWSRSFRMSWINTDLWSDQRLNRSTSRACFRSIRGRRDRRSQPNPQPLTSTISITLPCLSTQRVHSRCPFCFFMFHKIRWNLTTKHWGFYYVHAISKNATWHWSAGVLWFWITWAVFAFIITDVM